MKDQIDQSTPFLAFYDLLRIRGIYSEPERREKLRRGFRRAMALAAVLVALAVPQRASARNNALPDTATSRGTVDGVPNTALGTQPNYTVSGNTGTFTGAGTWTWSGGSTGFNVNGATVVLDGSGTFKFIDRSGAGSDITGVVNGSGANFVLVNPSGINFNGAQMNVASLVAAAMNNFSVGETEYDGSDLRGTVSVTGGSLPSSSVLLGRTVTGYQSGWTVVSGVPAGAKFTVPTGGTITFNGTTAEGTILQAGTVSMVDGSTVSGGSVESSGNIEGDFRQTQGSVAADGNITGTLTKSGTGSTRATTIASLEQSGGTVNATTITSLSQTGGSATADTIGSLTQASGNGAATANVSIGTLNQTASGASATTAAVTGTDAANVGGTVRGVNGSISFAGAVSQTANGTIDAGSGGIITVGNGGSLAGNLTAGTLRQTGGSDLTVKGNTLGIAFQQEAGTATIGTINGRVTQSDGATLRANAAGTGTLTLGAGGSLGGTVSAGTLRQTGGTDLTVKGDALDIAFEQTGGQATIGTFNSTVKQSGGTINATTFNGSVEQTAAGAIQAKGADTGLSFGAAFGPGNQMGSVKAEGGTITLAGKDTLSGTVTAGRIGYGSGVADDAKTITQTAGTITVSGTTADSLAAKGFTQNGGTLTLSGDYSGTISQNASAAGTRINATTLSGSVTQAAGNTGSIAASKLSGAVTQNAGTISARDGALELTGTIDQQGGSVSATTLTLNNADATVGFDLSRGANNIRTLSGKAKSVSVNNGANDISLSGLETTDAAGVTVTAAKGVTLDGVTAAKIDVRASSGDVKDTASQTAATTVSLGTADTKVGGVALVNGSGAITVVGINASGDVGIQNASITQNGSISSGKNVSLVSSGKLETKAAVTAADGDILVQSTGNDVTVGAQTLSATEGNIVIQGRNVSVNGATLSAKTGVGIAATDDSAAATDATKGTATIQNSDIVAQKAVVTSYGDLEISGVRMGKTAAADKDADLTVYTENGLKMGLDTGTRPTKSIRIAGAKTMDADLTQEITLETFAINSESDLDLTFSTDTKEISVESAGAVKVKTQSDVDIFNNAVRTRGESVSARNVAVPADSPVVVSAGVSADKAAHGLVGRNVALDAGGKVTVKNEAIVSSTASKLVLDTTAAGKAIDVQKGATVKSAQGVELKSGAGLVVAGTVLDRDKAADATGGGIALSSADGKDVDISGTVDSKGALTIDSGNDVKLSGTVVAADTLKATARKGIRQTGGSVTANSAGKVSTLEAKGGPILLARTDNDFDTVDAKATKGSISIADANALKVAGATADGGSIRLGTAGGTLDVNGAVSAENVTLDATGGKVTTDADVTATAGDVYIHTTADGIEIKGNVRADGHNVVLDADAGQATIGAGAKVAAKGVGIRGGSLAEVKDSQLSGVEDLALVATAGGATLTQVPAGVENLGIEVTGGDLTVRTTGDTTFNGASVAAASVGTGGAVSKASAKTTVTAAGLSANGRNSDVSATVTDGRLTANAVDAGGNVALSATSAQIGTATAGGTASVRTTGRAEVGSITGSDATVRSDNGNVVLTGTATARTGAATVQAPNGSVTGGGNVTARNGNATVSTATGGGRVAVGSVIARNGGVATVNGTSVRASSIAGDGGTRVTARTGNVTVSGAIGDGGNTTVSADDDVGAGSITAEGTVSVTAGGSITATAGAIAGGAGTTVTKNRAGGTISAAGNDIGEGGATTIDANGAAVTAGRLVSGAGNALDVNDAGAVNANIAAGGAATIQAASLTAGQTQTGGDLTFDNVGGEANVGNLAVGGDLGGQVGGAFTTAGGTAGTIGQQGGGLQVGSFQMNGDLTVGGGGGAVDIQAGNGAIAGGNNTLTAGALTLAGGPIGEAGQSFQVASANLQNITGSSIYLTDTAGAQVQIGTVDSTGVLNLALNLNGGTATGGAGSLLESGGPMTLTINGVLGTTALPVNVNVGQDADGNRTLIVDGTSPNLLHIVLQGGLDPSDLDVTYTGGKNVNGRTIGFILYRPTGGAGGWQVLTSPDSQRLINRALAFTVNTPELKSKQGIFGDPAMVHTKMNVSEARPGANMDLLALSSAKYEDTWETLVGEKAEELAAWSPSVDFSEGSPLFSKMDALRSEIEMQPEIQPLGAALPDAPAETAGEAPAEAPAE